MRFEVHTFEIRDKKVTYYFCKMRIGIHVSALSQRLLYSTFKSRKVSVDISHRSRNSLKIQVCLLPNCPSSFRALKSSFLWNVLLALVVASPVRFYARRLSGTIIAHIHLTFNVDGPFNVPSWFPRFKRVDYSIEC